MDPSFLIISIGENELPHWQYQGAVYHISFRLADSMPQSVLKKWQLERDSLIETAKNQYDLLKREYLKKTSTLEKIQEEALQKVFKESEREAHHLYSAKKEQYLDAGHGKCYLSNPEIAKMIADALIHFDKSRYKLHAWCIMPNHVHVIVEIFSGYDLSEIIHSWKSFTAHRANKILGIKGTFWQPDAYNHIIRSENEYYAQIQYVWKNPDKAHLKDWKWRWRINAEQYEVN